MERNERIYIPPKERDLPRRYRMGLDRPQYNWRHVGAAIGCVVALTGVIWWVWP